MRLDRLLTMATFTLVPAAASGESGQSDAASRLATAAQSYPPCALNCLGNLIPQSPCSFTDLECLCTNVPLNQNITLCVKAGCSPMEGLTTKNVSMTMCGAPVRDSSVSMTLVGVIFGSLALIAMIMRVCSLFGFRGRSVGWDDATIAVTWAFSVPMAVFAPIMAMNGFGTDMWTLSREQIERVLYYYFLGEICYITAIAFTKISILFLLLHVFPGSTFRNIVYVTMAFCGGTGIAFVFATLFQCSPVSYSWEQLDITKQGRCNNINLQAWVSAALNISQDLIILILPLKKLYGLKINLRKKIMVMAVFCVGIFITIVSCIRLHSLFQFGQMDNITWDGLPAAIWSVIEVHVGIICACMPSMRSLLANVGVKFFGSTSGSRDDSNVRSKFSLNTDKSQTLLKTPKLGNNGDFVLLEEVQSIRTGDT